MSLGEPQGHIILPRFYIDHVMLLHGIAWLSSTVVSMHPLFDTCFLSHIPTYGAHRNPGPRTMKWQRQIRQDSA
jgi:hypothetical protein